MLDILLRRRDCLLVGRTICGEPIDISESDEPFGTHSHNFNAISHRNDQLGINQKEDIIRNIPTLDILSVLQR